MKVLSLEVKKLFGVLDHTIPLKTEDRMTIIHGSNGFGKTTLLEIINSFFNIDFAQLSKFPFSQFIVKFDDNSEVEVTQNLEEQGNLDKFTIKYLSSTGVVETYSPLFRINEEKLNIPVPLIEDVVPGLDQIGSRAWRYLPTGEILDLGEVVTRFRQYFSSEAFTYEDLPSWLVQMKESIPIQLIQTQRLFIDKTMEMRRRPERRILEHSVSIYASELAKDIESRLTEYGHLSQNLDRTFPARLVRLNPDDELSSESLLKKLDKLEIKRKRLVSLGLLDNNAEPDLKVNSDEIDDRTRSVLSIYVEDMEAKLHVFDSLAKRVDLLKRIINKRFKFKEMIVNKEKGITFFTSAGETLQPTSLSSGEQHQIVLLYELLFKIKNNSFILIDEPELSLHIAWQVQFLKDLEMITKVVPFDVLIATHSPQIINDRWDLTVDLESEASVPQNAEEENLADEDDELDWWEL